MMNNKDSVLPAINNHSIIKYYLFLYLRNTVYYIRIKQGDKNTSLSLKTVKRHIAVRLFTIIKHELSFIIKDKPTLNYEQLINYFKTTVSNEFNHQDNSKSNDCLLIQTSSIELPLPSQAILSINELCNNYIQEKGSNWKYATQLSSQANKALLIEIFDYLKLNDVSRVTRKDMLEVREVIKRLPVNRKQVFKDQPLANILNQSYDKTLSIRTINGHLIFLSSVFNWAEKNDLIKKNLATDLLLKDSQKEADKRNAFSLKQIELILSSCKSHYARNGLAWL